MSSRTLLGKSALVTGATSGIGEVTAYALAAAGAHVLVVGRRSDLGNDVVRTIGQSGGKAKFFAADMRSSEEINAMVDCAVNEFGKLDIAFNNAGIFDRMNDFHIYSDDSWDEMLAVNLTGVFRCMRAELASMITSGGGVIINNASTVSHRGSLRASPAYVAAKHGVLGLTKQAAIQYVNQGVRVNAVSPGPTETAMSAPLVAQGAEAVAQALAQLNPTGKFVSPEAIAQTVVFLASDSAKMINGSEIVLDGGQLALL
ncbi:MAG: SDR family oxidoreductase [Actinomycetota bacterium]|nr:SDR family oxidoreductase [Actinomycetota bacterium]MDA3020238.1 SDR family oxidoreductase [Actinomycetota bacterium]